MRIIGGTARSRTFEAPKGMDTRPTLDRIRESLFNILQARCQDARVLDLFAGSGALSLESLSRGAAFAVLVDMDRQATAIEKRNLEKLGFAPCSRVLNLPWNKAVSMLVQEEAAFDIVFLDPPYRMTEVADILGTLIEKRLLAPKGIMVVEHATKTPPNEMPQVYCFDRRRYGDTSISFYSRAEEV